MNRLKELRNQRKLTLDDIEEKTGIKRGTYSNYENGKTEPKMETWNRLADFFNVSIPYLQGLPEPARKNRLKELRQKKNRGDLDTEMLTKIINTIYLIICNRIPMSSDRETIDNTENSRTIAATELMLLMYQTLNLDHNKQFKEIVSKNANLLGIKGKAKLDYIRESSISATDENYQSDIENAKSWIKFYENL